MKSVWIFFIGIVLFSTASTAQEPDSLGSFEPKTDVAFVAAENPTWNGKPVPIVKDDKDGLLIGFFNFTRVKIPDDVRVQFKGFDIVFITSEEEVEIRGAMTQSIEGRQTGVLGFADRDTGLPAK
jgi:hypothetical protein